MSMPPFLNAGDKVIIYDGVCKLCNAWVIFLLSHHIDRKIRFVAIQSEKGKTLLRYAGLPDENIRTIVLINQNQHWLRSQAICRAMAFMPWPWKVLSLIRFLPDFITDFIYNRIAQNRYRLFGHYDDVHEIKEDYPGRFL
ncbi:DUF393 domain-containing protein [Pantoea sp. SM3]|uniref:thiol-disulfide oxidoreductase DCC family protein n=1 Tax=Pantoea sp. SM3 TaxID=1628192 RepID=UPI0005F7C802|nr:DCC1-like thiol-disulfide oxidoreductase family protein [Pantoea sp. SM3]KJV31707.1 thiol-disulfide oxidoreductase [Pantoea sp. SM3]